MLSSSFDDSSPFPHPAGDTVAKEADGVLGPAFRIRIGSVSNTSNHPRPRSDDWFISPFGKACTVLRDLLSRQSLRQSNSAFMLWKELCQAANLLACSVLQVVVRPLPHRRQDEE